MPYRLRFAIPVIFCAISAAFGQPAVSVSPKSGPPTDKVHVRGAGFAADEALDIYFDTTDLALATTGPGGSFDGIRLTIPASAVPGTHWITGVGRRSGLAAQTSFLVQTDWPQDMHGPQHHGYNPTENVLNVSNVAGLQIRWSVTGGHENTVSPSPVVAEGVVYVALDPTLYGKFYAFDAATGKQLWSASTGTLFLSAAAVADGVVYVGSVDHNLYAFNAKTGQQLWSAATGAPVDSSPAVANGLVYAASDKVYAFNASTGQLIWSAAAGSTIGSSPAVANGIVYVGSYDDLLYAFNAATGRLLWRVATGNAIISSPAVANGVVYVGSDDRKLYAFNAAGGQPLWSATTGGSVDSPAVANGVVYVGSLDGNLYAFNAATGQQLWSAPTGNQIQVAPAVANGVIYVGPVGGEIYAFNAATGQQLWGATTPNWIASPAVVNGIVYVASYGGNLDAFGLPPADPPARPDPGTLKPDLTLLPQE